MTNDTLKSDILRELYATAEQINRLGILESALEAVQRGEDFRPFLRKLDNHARYQTTENPLEPVSEIEQAVMKSLSSALEARRKVKEDEVSQLLGRVNQFLEQGNEEKENC